MGQSLLVYIYIYIPSELARTLSLLYNTNSRVDVFFFVGSCYRDAVPKQCCGLGSPPVRWSILGVGIVGLVCAAAGALLGALKATGRDHIAVSLLMIGEIYLIGNVPPFS